MPHPARTPFVALTPPGRSLALVALLSTMLTVVVLTAMQASSDAVPDRQSARRAVDQVGLLPAGKPSRVDKARSRPLEVGMRFRPKVAGRATGVRVYQAWHSARATPSSGSLWGPKGNRLATARFAPSDDHGWVSVRFARAVPLQAGVRYVVSVFAPRGRHAATSEGFSHAKENSYLRAGRRNGVFTFTKAASMPTRVSRDQSNYWVDVRFAPDSATPPPTPTPTPTPTPNPGGWPGPGNTGVPAGTTLTPYTGPCTITSARTLSAVDATKCDALVIQARDVVIDKSLVPRVESTVGDSGSVTITDSSVRGGDWVDGSVWGYNISATRVDVTGGQHSFHCNDNCILVDSWLHDQYNPDGQSFHNNAFISNGGTNMLVRHNTLHCTPLLNATDGGCTADVSLFGDFDPITNVTVDRNLLKANNSSISYCAYGGYSPSKPFPVAEGIVFTNNVFERGTNNKCGVYGPVTAFQKSATGNVWSGNVWSDGSPVNP